MTHPQAMFLAKALFDNIAETPDELAFRRGDVLQVLEQEPGGLEGWWLCEWRGKSGIAPGNRLKILTGMVAGGSGEQHVYGQAGMDVYDHPSPGSAAVGTPSYTPTYTPGNTPNYTSPANNTSAAGQQDYDVPPAHRGSVDRSSVDGFSTPTSRKTSSYGAETGTLRGSNSRLNLSSSSSNSRQNSLGGGDLYDTPPSSKRASADGGGELYDTPPSSKRVSSERTPPHSNRSSAARDLSGSQLSGSQLSLGSSSSRQLSGSSLSLSSTLQRRRGSRGGNGENCYDTPPGSNRSSLERVLCEEGPPPVYDTLSPATSIEQMVDDDGEATYDTPPTRTHNINSGLSGSQVNLLAGSSQGSGSGSQVNLRPSGSIESLLSNTSGVSSAQLSHSAASLPDSARSSMDLNPSEIYDVPPSQKETDHLHNQQQYQRSRKQLSTDSGLGFYDSPVKSRPSSSSSGQNHQQQQPPPSLRTSQSSNLDCKTGSPAIEDIKRSRSLEHALDDVYDVPKNNNPRVNFKKAMTPTSSLSTLSTNNPSGGVYDIPPQVTRDSVISSRSDSSDENNQRFSSSSFDLDQHLASQSSSSDLPGMLDELFLDMDSALEVLIKRQQAVNKATSRLCGFVTDEWRTRASLEKSLYDIKVSCSGVNSSLHDYVAFAKGAVANAAKHAPQGQNRELAARLSKLVSPLQSTLEFVRRSFSNLEDMKWQVSLLLLTEPYDKLKPDDLGQIALVAKDLMPEVKKVSSFIQSNSCLIFRRHDVKKPSSTPSSSMTISNKPPVGPKGDLSKSPYGKSPKANPTLAQRPLPAVPGSSPTPSADRLTSSVSAYGLVSPGVNKDRDLPLYPPKQKNRSMYDIKAELHQDDYAEPDDFPDCVEQQSGGDVVEDDCNSNTLTKSHDCNNSGGKAHKDLMEQCVQEYDYVQLDSIDGKMPADDVSVSVSSSNSTMTTTTRNVSESRESSASASASMSSRESSVGSDTAAPTTPVTPTNKNSDLMNQSKVEEDLAHEVSGMLAGMSMGGVYDVDMVPVRDSGSLPPTLPRKKDNSSSSSSSNMIDRSISEMGRAILDSCSNRAGNGGESADSDFVDSAPARTTAPPVPDSSSTTSDSELTPVNTDSSQPVFIETAASTTDCVLDPNDRQVLAYYTDQINTHATLLANAVDAFLSVVGSNQPPNVFISHGKFVIVSAHKLVYIGDSIHRNLISNAISARIMGRANHLCDCLKASVTATKTAALQYPSVPAVQDMVARVMGVLHAAQELKTVITQSL